MSVEFLIELPKETIMQLQEPHWDIGKVLKVPLPHLHEQGQHHLEQVELLTTREDLHEGEHKLREIPNFGEEWTIVR
jgi:hypothetical protein